MNQLLTIRPLQAEEFELALNVYRQCEDFLALGPVSRASMEMVRTDVEHSQAQGGRYCGIYDQSGQMIGVVDYVPGGFEGKPDQAALELLMIAQPYRGQGIGAEVVRQVEALIRQDARVQTIWSGVQVNNPAAVRFWQRMGYTIVSGPQRQPDSTITYQLRKAIEERPVLYRAMQAGEEAAVCDLVLRCFNKFVGPEYSPEGNQEFLKYAQPAAMRERCQQRNFVLVAHQDDELAGMIEIRDYQHVSLLFVDEQFQRRGISRELLRHALAVCRAQQPEVVAVTVNSSPYAVPVYEHLGFRALGPEQIKNGIRFLPMALDLREQ